MAKEEKDTKSTTKSKEKAPAKKKAAKKAAPKKLDLQDLDRKGLAARARQIKTELLAIRFNLHAPSLRDYRSKKKELSSVLGRLGSKQEVNNVR